MRTMPERQAKAALFAGADIGPFGRYEGEEVYGIFSMVDANNNAVDYVMSKEGAETIIKSAQAFIDIIDGKNPFDERLS